MEYRKLTDKEIQQLKEQACLSDNWDKISEAKDFTPEHIHHTRFSGEIRLGAFNTKFTLPGGIKKHSGLRHVTLHNATIGNNCCIENLHNDIAN